MIPRATVDIRGCPRQVPRLLALPRQLPRLWPRYVPRFCLWQTPSYHLSSLCANCRGSFHAYPRSLTRTQRCNHHESPRKSAAIVIVFPADVHQSIFHAYPWPTAAIATAILRYASITMKICGSLHLFPHTCRCSVRGKLSRKNHARGSPWHLPRQFPRKLRTKVRLNTPVLHII